MAPLAGTKRPAETPVASPTKAAALTKKSRTHYDYYEEDDAEQSEEEPWSGDDWSDDSSVMDLDDADEGFEDELLSPDDLGDDDFDEKSGRYCSEQVTKVEKNATPSPDSFSYCRCNFGRRQVGRACEGEKCGCRGQEQCDNPFNDLDTEAIFGPAKVTLHPCFISWMTRQQTVKPADITTQFLFNIAHDQTQPVFFEDDGACAEWQAKWTELGSLEKADDPGVALQQQLIRLAFTHAPSNDIFYSFCRKDEDLHGYWRSAGGTRHCRTCGKCAKIYDCQSPGCHEF